MMYYLFRQYRILPGDYYRLPAGDKAVIRAFISAEMEDREAARWD